MKIESLNENLPNPYQNHAFYAFFQTVGAEQEKATKEAKEMLKMIEDEGIGDRKFFGGEEIGMADLVFGWIAGWLEYMEEAVGVKLIEDDEFPRLQAWIKNFRDSPVIKDNLPDPEKSLAYFKSLRERFVALATA